MCSVEVQTVWQVSNVLYGSDHYPIFITAEEYTRKQDSLRWCTCTVNWDTFPNLLEKIADVPTPEPSTYNESICSKINKIHTKMRWILQNMAKTIPLPNLIKHLSHLFGAGKDFYQNLCSPGLLHGGVWLLVYRSIKLVMLKRQES